MHVLLAAWLAAAAPAAAAAPVELRWDAPASCPTEAEVRADVEALLGAPLTTPRPTRMTVISVVQARAPGWSLRIFTVTPGGTRERALRYENDCELLTRAATVLIAMAIDPEVLGKLDPERLALVEAPAEPAPTEPAPTEPAPTEPAPTEPAAPTPTASTPVAVPSPAKPAVPPTPPAPFPRRAAPQGGLRLLGGIGRGDLPAVGGGFGLVGSLIFPRLRIEATAHVWPLRRVRLGDTQAGADFLLWTLGARVCPRLRPHPRLELPICLGFEAGQVHARAVRLVDTTDERAPWFALVLAPALVVTLTPRVALWLAPELAVPVIRTGFRIADVGLVHRPAPVVVRVLLGVELRIPPMPAMDRPPGGNKRRGPP